MLLTNIYNKIYDNLFRFFKIQFFEYFMTLRADCRFFLSPCAKLKFPPLNYIYADIIMNMGEVLLFNYKLKFRFYVAVPLASD